MEDRLTRRYNEVLRLRKEFVVLDELSHVVFTLRRYGEARTAADEVERFLKIHTKEIEKELQVILTR